ncbi:MAG: preprotein translocase subunit SecF [Gammaproteobacteria bacterium SG8_31]|jgi:preprotein translocase subunit SecF|nr:MAG: preprotein translocase subunit SecF [Gammaproteobacteria bacterium SG8_31]
MEFLSKTTHLDFMGKRRLALAFSAALIVLSLIGLFARGLNFGIEFTGGVVIEVGFPMAADLTAVRSGLAEAGFGGAVVQNFGSSRDVVIQLEAQESGAGSAVRDRVMEVLRGIDSGVNLRRVEFVGPQVGEELAEAGGLATLFALLMILGYVAFRFQWKFAVGAVAALVHDVIITLGFFAYLHLPFDLAVLAAILAVIGYSLNDTIVVFDRIRENLLRIRKHDTVEVMNLSINQMLARTLMTSGTTMLVLLALFIFGGEAIHGFSTALIVGVAVGTYSSIYIASPTALALDVTATDLMPPQKEESEIDALP